MQKHAALTIFGLVFGIAMLAWVEPNTSGGASLLVVLCIFIANASGAAFGISKPDATKPKAAAPPQSKSSVRSAKKRLYLLPFLLIAAQMLNACSADTPTASRGGLVGGISGALGSKREGWEASAAEQTAERTKRLEAAEQRREQQVLELRRRQLSLEARQQAREPQPSQSAILGALLGNESDASSRIWNFGVARRESREGGLATRRPLVPARMFLRSDQIPPPRVAAYGVVALRARPTPATEARLRAACTAFLASLPERQSLPSSVPEKDLMLTIWPIFTAGDAANTDFGCDYLLANYDLHAGLSAIQDAELQGASLTGRGPYLIGWSPSNTRGVRDAVVLVVDTSSFESQQSFDEAFLFWQRKIVEDPQLWRSGFSLERVRLAIRDFVDKYGQGILDSIKLVKLGD
ncbi:hypothetical protein [Paracraurococcus lichenis]|uniref:Uncharacterized protein n=1 Tax=Paracraurococcus lichenis TaxID=3064888 RepID=A0ABT9E785_9PROT|nr:hypothetical protein [Paracraurococcus sp. LOR1-02]MDO9711989.1 hypothetical protein [Paracraurococcus sp. LOR1-02]